MTGLIHFIQKHTVLAPLAALSDISLYQAESMDKLWRIIESESQDPDCPPPFWAFAWAGGIGLARYILDHPQTVKGLRILDFASGSGIVGIAAARSGANSVTLCDIDPLAQASAGLNAQANNADVRLIDSIDMKKPAKGYDLIVAGDVCYDHLMAHRTLAWLRLCSAQGIKVLIGDPGRAYAPKEGVQTLATIQVQTSEELEDRTDRAVDILLLS